MINIKHIFRFTIFSCFIYYVKVKGSTLELLQLDNKKKDINDSNILVKNESNELKMNGLDNTIKNQPCSVKIIEDEPNHILKNSNVELNNPNECVWGQFIEL